MTNPVVIQLEQAAAPSLIAALQAFNQFEADIGTDPLQWAVKVPAAKLKFLGTLGLQLQPLIGAEVVAGENVINTTTSKWITSLQALSAQKST
jgi:hypothetical protein